MSVRRIDGSFVRDVEGEWTTGGYPLSVHLAGRDDVSPIHRTYPSGYDPACGWCWLGAPHTVDAHAAKVADALASVRD